MGGWHHRHGFGWTPGVGDGRAAWRAAVRGVAESDTPEPGRPGELRSTGSQSRTPGVTEQRRESSSAAERSVLLDPGPCSRPK